VRILRGLKSFVLIQIHWFVEVLILKGLVASGESRVASEGRPVGRCPPPPGVLYNDLIRWGLARHFLQRCHSEVDSERHCARNAPFALAPPRIERAFALSFAASGKQDARRKKTGTSGDRNSSREGGPGQTRDRIAQ
jgi:hypothetical protein